MVSYFRSLHSSSAGVFAIQNIQFGESWNVASNRFKYKKNDDKIGLLTLLKKEQRTTLQIKQLAGNKKYNSFQNHMKYFKHYNFGKLCYVLSWASQYIYYCILQPIRRQKRIFPTCFEELR